MPKRLNEMVRIAAAGGGFDLDAGTYSVPDMVRIAAAGENKGPIRILNAASLQTAEIVRIATAGAGSVWFDL